MAPGDHPLAPKRNDVDSQPALTHCRSRSHSGRGPLRPGGAIEDSLPDAIGAFIAWLVDENTDGPLPKVTRRIPNGAC